MTRARLRIYPLLTFAAALALGVALDDFVADAAHRDARVDVLQRLSTLRARFEGLINGNVFLVRSMVAEIALDPDITQERFARLGRELLHERSQVRNVGAARDLVITHLHPLEGNEAALGLDYRTVPEQREAALRARTTGGIVIAGPVDLVQGGVGLICRVPVFTAREDGTNGARPFWGLVSIVLDVDAIYREAGILEPDFPLDLAIRGRDGRGATGAVFFGSPATYERDPVRVEVAFPNGTWELAAVPRAGWQLASATTWTLRAVVLAAAVFAALLVYLRTRQGVERSRVQAALRASEERLGDAIESIHEGFALWDERDRLVLCNSRYRDIYSPLADNVSPGDSYAEVLRRAIGEGHLNVDGDHEAWYAQRLESHRVAGSGAEVRLANGRVVRITERRTSDGGTVGIHTDITDKIRAEADIRQRAYFDPLTGLANRASFIEHLDSAIAHASRSRTLVALLFVDLDRFKNVNDTLGHDVGDALLEAAAKRLQGCLRSTDTVARLGGDEFTVILNHLTDELSPSVVAESILRTLQRPFVVGSHTIYCGASIGITLCPADGDDVTSLLRNADMAMYQAKEAGRGMVRYFTREMTERAQRFVSLERDLRHALETEQFDVHFQPVIDLATGGVAGGEALLRWHPPGRDPLSPADFIPVAEESGLIVPMGEWVLETACRAATTWHLQPGGYAPNLSVNVSSRQFRAGFDRRVVERVLGATGFPAERLVLEITESVLMEEDDRVHRVLRDLRDAGVGLAVDDFGTGYSSLSYLRRFPVTSLKIDRSFVADMDHDPADARLVESIIAMARGLGLSAVAEGVETSRQAEQLRRLRCDLAQGYLFGRPVPAVEFANAIRPDLPVPGALSGVG